MHRIRSIAVLIVAFTATMLPANATKIQPKPVDQLGTSLAVWKKANKKAEGNYTYTVSGASFSGARWTTTIVVRANKVVERRYDFFHGRLQPVAPGQAPVKQGPKWIEKGDDIGKHKEGAAPKTIDQLYVEAEAVVKRKLQPHEKLYVGFHKNGVLRHCFTVDTRIADDAPTRGPRISTVTMDTKK